MSIITISRGSYSRGKEIAERLARELGYECVSRDILLEASEHFNIPEIKLIRAIHDAPSVLDRFTHGKERYVAFVRETLLEYIQRDSVVYHGLAGQFFTRGIPNVLKVRIIANIDDRVREEMKREKISEEEARYVLKKDDEERRRWALRLYGIDTLDPSLYDIVLHIDNLTVKDAVDILSRTARLPCFQTTPESRSILQDRLVEARAASALAKAFPTAKVRCREGVVIVSVETELSLEAEIARKVEDLLAGVEGVKEVKTTVTPFGMYSL